MTSLSLHLHLDGETLTPRPITGSTPPDIAAAVHRHARGHLAGRRVDIHLDQNAMSGTVISHGATVGHFTLTAPETAQTPHPDTVLHGYTLTDLHAMAAAACTADRSMASDAHTRYDVAWSAIAEHLATVDQPPTRIELIRVGWQAIYTEIRHMRRTFGVHRADTTAGVASARCFVKYWTVSPVGPEDGLVERIAVHQIVDTLTPVYRDAVIALAAHGDYQHAADALGITYKALVGRIGTARKQLRALWFAPDTPPPARGTDRRTGAYGQTAPTHCKAGHAWTEENTRWDRSRSGRSAKVRRCRTCERDRSRARREKTAA